MKSGAHLILGFSSQLQPHSHGPAPAPCTPPDTPALTPHFTLLILLFLLVRGQEAWLRGDTHTVCFQLFDSALLSSVLTTKVFDCCFHCVVRFPFDA